MAKTINLRGYSETLFALRRFLVLAKRYKASPVLRMTDGGLVLFLVADRYAISWDLGQHHFARQPSDRSMKRYDDVMRRYVFLDNAPLNVKQKVFAFDIDYAPRVLKMISFAEYIEKKMKYSMIYKGERIYHLPDLEVINQAISGALRHSRFWNDDQLYITFSTPKRANLLLFSVNVAYRSVRDSLSGLVWGDPVTTLENLKAPD